VICSLDEYLERHRQAVAAGPRFEYDKYSLQFLTPERRDEMIAAVRQRDAYIVGGRTAELRGAGGTARTAQGGNQ
jgi:hypothetical protein